MSKRNPFKLCRNDIILAAAWAAAAIFLFAFLIIVKGKSDGNEVVVRIDGNEYARYSLNTNQVIEIDNEHGKNTVVIENGTVRMEYADCPDGYCISKGAVSMNGDTIVCLPHRLVVEVVKSETSADDLDAIAQ